MSNLRNNALVLLATLFGAVATPVRAQDSASVAPIAQASSPASPPGAADIQAALSDPSRPVHDKWAVVIGLTEFANPKIPRLRFATEDAKAFYQYLTTEANFAPDHVRLLFNEKATQRRVRSELGNKLLTRMVKPDDLVVIFISSHGSPSQMDAVEHKNYVVTYDSDPDDLYSTGIDMQEILGIIKHRVASDRVLLVMDACHSGGIDPNAKGMMRVGNFSADSLLEGSGKMVICSSSPEEQSWESKRYSNGVFTRHLLEGLRVNGARTTLNTAFKDAQDKISDEVRQDHPGLTQTPVLRSVWTGKDLILAVKPEQPTPLPPTVLADLEPDSLGRGGLVVPDAQIAMADPSKSISPSSLTGDRQGTIADAWDGKLNLAYLCKATKVPLYKTDREMKDALQSAFAMKDANFNDPQYKIPVAIIRIQMGSIGAANRELQELLVDNPGCWQAYLARAYCFHKLKQGGQAQDFLRQSQFRNPTLPATIDFGD
jgi:hypothetical protein